MSTWGGTDNTAGEIYALDHVTGATGPDKVTATKIAGGLKEPMGLKVVDGVVYVSQKHELTELRDSDGDGSSTGPAPSPPGRTAGTSTSSPSDSSTTRGTSTSTCPSPSTTAAPPPTRSPHLAAASPSR